MGTVRRDSAEWFHGNQALIDSGGLIQKKVGNSALHLLFAKKFLNFSFQFGGHYIGQEEDKIGSIREWPGMYDEVLGLLAIFWAIWCT